MLIIIIILQSTQLDRRTQAATATVTPPPIWPQPSVGASYLPPSGQTWTDPTILENLKRQIDQLNNQLASKTEENDKLKSEVSSLKSQAVNAADLSEAESTLIPSQVPGIQASRYCIILILCQSQLL